MSTDPNFTITDFTDQDITIDWNPTPDQPAAASHEASPVESALKEYLTTAQQQS